MSERITYTLDTKSNPKYYIVIRPDGTELSKCSKACNNLAKIINYFNITHIDDREVTEEDKVYVPNTSEI